MKNYKVLVAIVLVVLTVVSAYNLMSTAVSDTSKYNAALEKARYCSKRELVDAASYYDEALSIKKSIEVYDEYFNFYLKQDDFDGATMIANQMVDAFPNDSRGYYNVLAVNEKHQDYKGFFYTYNLAKKKNIISKEIEEIYKKNEYQYFNVGRGYINVKNLMNDYYAVQNEKGFWGYTDQSGSVVISCEYEYAGGFSSDMAPVKDMNGKVYYINSDNKRKFVLDSKEKYDYLGAVVNDSFVVGFGDKYSYYNTNMEKLFGDYEYAGTFNYGIAAIKKSGNWCLIDENGKVVSDNYDRILMNANDVACLNGRVVATKGSEQYILNEKGQVVKKTDFSDIAVASSGNLIAYKKDNKWGFCDLNGNVVIKPQYDSARSFSHDYAAVCKNGKWGFINADNKTVIDYKFDVALDFSESGCAYVSENGGDLSMIKLYKFNYV